MAIMLQLETATADAVRVTAFPSCSNCHRGISCRVCKRDGDGSPNANNTYDTAGVKSSTNLTCYYVSSSNNSLKNDLKSGGGGWSRQQKRAFHRANSILSYWQQHGYQVLWLTLTTAAGGDASKLSYNHQRLRQRVSYVSAVTGIGHSVASDKTGKPSVLGYSDIQHFSIKTTEGNGVLHVLWAWQGQRSFYIPQAWLSDTWAKIHGASVVWVARVGGGSADVASLSRYLVSQYCSLQHGFKYMSYSWGKSFGFPLVSCWRAYKRSWAKVKGGGSGFITDRDAMLRYWHGFMGGRALPMGDRLWLTMGWFKASYHELGAFVWSYW